MKKKIKKQCNNCKYKDNVCRDWHEKYGKKLYCSEWESSPSPLQSRIDELESSLDNYKERLREDVGMEGYKTTYLKGLELELKVLRWIQQYKD
jgi:flagellar biosynthesis chaperone FliJ